MSFLTLHLPAKINLGLSIRGRTANGYHLVDTVMAKIPLCDILELDWAKPGEATTIYCTHRAVPNNQSNLLWRAYQSLANDFSLPPVTMRLQKNIPVGAGLGGGSSDAGGLLAALNKQLHLGLQTHELRERALRLGADVPFAARAEKVSLEQNHGLPDLRITALPFLPSCRIVLVYQRLFLSTAQMYRDIDACSFLPANLSPLVNTLRHGDLSAIAAYLSNDFSYLVESRYPLIAETRQKLLDAGALGVGLSGKGPTLFGLFPPQKLPILPFKCQVLAIESPYDQTSSH